MNLYTMSNEYQFLLDKEELDHEDMERLVALHDSVEQKAINVAAYIKNMESFAQQLKVLMSSISGRQAILEKKVETMRAYLLDHLSKCHIDTIDHHPEFSIKVKKNPVKVIAFNEPMIPMEYFVKTEVTRLDKDKLKKAIQEGQSIDGARLESSMRVEIR